MSNRYPPTPSFGGAHTGYTSADAALRDGGPSTRSAGGGPPAPQHRGSHTASSPTDPRPAMNIQRFQANATISNTAHAIPPPIPPPPFQVPPHFFNQFPNSTLPPPPYPPVPIAHLGFAHFPPPPPNVAATSTPPTVPLRNSSLHQTSPPPSHTSHAAPPRPQVSHTSTREEGELSDGELDECSPESMIERGRPVRTDQPTSSVMPMEITSPNHEAIFPAQSVNSAAQSTPANRESAITQASATRQGVLSDVGKMGNVFQRQKEVEDDRVPSADDGSISSYNPPSASTPDPAEPDMNSLELPTWESSHFGNTSIAAKAFHTDRATLSLREQVKDALRSLKLHNIKYNELVGEGVEPSLLRGLYEDIDQKLVQAKLRSPVVEVGQISDPQKIALQTPQEGQELPGRSSKYAGQNLHPAPTTTDKSSTSIPVKTTSETQANSSVAGLTKTSPSPVVSTEKAAVASSSSNVAVERKDRIAQLLAAKTGKAVPARLAPEIQPHVPARILKPDSSVDTATKPASLPQKPPAPPEKPPAPPKKPPALPEKPSVPPKKPPALPEKPPVPAPEPLVKPKNKAQTELLRQKMEALKREALAKSQAQSALNEDSVASSPTSATPSFAPQPQPLGPTVSTADVGSSGLGSQIPGLFMMNEVYPSNPDITNERADHALAEKVDDPVSINSTATSVGPGMSAEFETDLVQSPGGHILPVRLPQKRPLPSDSFDESMPSLKRPFGRKHSDHRVEIVVSDAESEGEVEDVEMELDEESDEEKQAPEDDGVPAVSVRQTNMRNLPPLTDIPSAKQTLQFAGAISTPTSAAVQTPGRENDNEELWKAKYQEIELMRKKIAEMEERHKAKQNATRAISPKAAGRTAPPVIRTSLARPSQAASPGLPKPSVNAKADLSSNALQSPVLTPSGPEELPGTPSTPLDAIKEPLKAEDLRQQLLRRKPTKEETPSFAEMKLRKAQLAEKRAKLADLRREAEKHEEEILEESKLLDAQLQAGLNGEDAYEQRPFHANGDVAEDTRTKGLAASDVLPQTHRDEQGVSVEGSPSAAKASRVSQVEQQPNEAASRALPAAGDIVLQPSDEDGIVRDVAAFERVVPSVEQDIDHAQELLGDSLSTPADESVEIGTVPQQDNFPAVLLAETGPMEVKSPSPWIEDKTTDETRPDPVDSNFFDEDGSVSMSDGASEDYEPAEPDQMGGDQPENDSEFYEPADVALPVAAQLSPSQRDEVVEVDQPATNGQMQSTSTLEKTVLPTLVHDAEDGMQLTEPDVINKPQIISQPHGDDRIDQIPLSTSHFTPYETPRRNLKNFRYYDHFPAMVSSGYKSLTFSNNIDPGKPFCPTELAGDTCHDPICEEQHFRQVEMTDDKILAQMSTANNLRTKAEHERWVAGLRQVIADLRSKGVKDFHMVASALAAYRRRFSEELSTPTSASSQS